MIIIIYLGIQRNLNNILLYKCSKNYKQLYYYDSREQSHKKYLKAKTIVNNNNNCKTIVQLNNTG